MNISQINLTSNNFSNEKIHFYEKLGSKYNHAYIKYKKKYPNNKDFRKNIINWIFSKDEETRMILCSIENKKYTNILKEAYNEYDKSSYTKFYLKDSGNEKEIKLLHLNNSKLISSNSHDYYFKEINLIKDIKFYQCESPLKEYSKYSNYFTFFNILKNNTNFINMCDYFTNNKFLECPIKLENDLNKTFQFPNWLYENNISGINDKYEYYKEGIDIKLYYSISKFIIALLEQVLSVRYLIYYDTNNLESILSSVYLYDLFQKRNNLIMYLTPKEKKFSYLYFKIDELASDLYNDDDLKNFIEQKKIKEKPIFNIENIEIYFNEDDELNNIILEGNNFFNNFLKSNNPKDFVDFFLLLNIKQLFTYDDFYFRGIFEKIYETYLNQNIKDLIYGDENEKGKKRKKKKKKKNEKISDNKFNEENESEQIKSNKTMNTNFGDEVLKILNESNINEDKNVNQININKKEELNINTKDGNKINENKINLISEKEKDLIKSFIKNLIFESLFKQIKLLDYQKYIIFKSEKKKNKEFFLYDATESNKRKKKNKENIENITNINKNIMNKDENHEQITKINNIEDENKNDFNKLNIPIPLHISSMTFSSSSTKTKEKDKIINNNNINEPNYFMENWQNSLIANNSIKKLHNDIKEYNNILEEALNIQRKIKEELFKYFSSIVKIVYPNSEIKLYGSTLYNLDIDNSDLDLSISTKEKITLLNLEKYLKENNKNNQYSKINGIFSASVPIIKLEIDYLKIENDDIKKSYELLKETIYYKKCCSYENIISLNKINVDISLNSINIKQIEFIKDSLSQYPQIIPLIKILKKILQLKNMNNSYYGGMSSYCLFLLVYSYIKFLYKQIDNEDNNEINYGSILMGILFFYTNYIDFTYTIIDPSADIPFISEYALETIPTIIEPISKQNAGKIIYKIFDVVECLRQLYNDLFMIMEIDINDNLIFSLIEDYSKQ